MTTTSEGARIKTLPSELIDLHRGNTVVQIELHYGTYDDLISCLRPGIEILVPERVFTVPEDEAAVQLKKVAKAAKPRAPKAKREPAPDDTAMVLNAMPVGVAVAASAISAAMTKSRKLAAINYLVEKRSIVSVGAGRGIKYQRAPV